tara:strand:- start:76 stop:675 length:600 start_codon:yes stop_codon:yes gene_type:complete
VDLNYNSINVFPTIIHQFDVNGFDDIQNQLIDYAYEFKNKNPEGVKVSNYGGWQSPNFDVNDENDLLQSFIINCLSNFPNIDKSINFDVDAWININKPGDYNTKHHHPNCHLSGVLWVKAPEECGRIQFQSPVEFQTYTEVQSYTEEFKNSNNYFHTYYFSPIEGRILVFPSHLQHEVLENKSNEDRISVSFNIDLING